MRLAWVKWTVLATTAVALAASPAEAASSRAVAKSGVHKARSHKSEAGRKGRVRLAPRPPSYLYQPPRVTSQTPSVRIENPTLPKAPPCVGCPSPSRMPAAAFPGLAPNPVINPGLTGTVGPYPSMGPGAR